MTALQSELIKTANELSDDSIKNVLEYVHTFVIPFESKTNTAGSNSNDKLKAFLELDARVLNYPPITDPEKDIQDARDEKYGVID